MKVSFQGNGTGAFRIPGGKDEGNGLGIAMRPERANNLGIRVELGVIACLELGPAFRSVGAGRRGDQQSFCILPWVVSDS